MKALQARLRAKLTGNRKWIDLENASTHGPTDVIDVGRKYTPYTPLVVSLPHTERAAKQVLPLLQRAGSNKGDYALFDRERLNPQNPKRQAGFVTWAALAFMLALVPIVGIGLVESIRVIRVQNECERAVVRFSEHILVPDTPKENLSDMGAAIKLDMPIWKGLSALGAWRENIGWMFDCSHGPNWKFVPINSLTERPGGKLLSGTQSPFDLGNESWSSPVVVNRHAPGTREIGSFGRMFGVEFVSWITKKTVRSTTMYIGALMDPVGVVLLSSQTAQGVGGPRHNDRVPSNESGGERDNRGVVLVKQFSDMPERDKRNVIGGALFLAGLCIFAAYLAIQSWRVRKRNKKRSDGD